MLVDDLVAITKVLQYPSEYSFEGLIVSSSVSCLLACMESLMYIQSVHGFVCSELIQKAAVWHQNPLGGFENFSVNTCSILKTLEKMWMPKQKKRGLIKGKKWRSKSCWLRLVLCIAARAIPHKISDAFLLKCVKSNRRVSVRNTERQQGKLELQNDFVSWHVWVTWVIKYQIL